MKKKIPKRKNKPGAGPPLGSNNAEALKTPAERQEAYRLYCLHLAAGYSASCFYEPVCDDTIDDMLKKYPHEFDFNKLRQARSKGKMLWEDIGLKGTIGKIKGFNAHSWKFNMQNRLNWKDRTETGLDQQTRAVFRIKMGKDFGNKEED